MHKGWNTFFVTMGVIFTVLLIVWIAFVLIARAGGKTVQFNAAGGPGGMVTVEDTAAAEDRHPLLSAEQEAAVRAFGIDPADLPMSITAEQEACVTAKLGAARIAEIKAGAVPTMGEYFSAKDCF